MTKVYQPIVIEETENLMLSLEETNFFVDYEINDLDFVKEYLLNKINDKYILGLLNETEEIEEFIFTDEEFEKLLSEIVAGSVLRDLKKMGHVDSYEDENTEEVFFLTEKGKEHLRNK